MYLFLEDSTMNEKTLSCLTGLLSMERLFVGSKSEGLYPVLHADDGQHYRLHYKGDISLNEKTLAPFEGKTVQVIGSVDNLRGHWRMVLAADTSPLVIEASTISPDVASEATFEDVPEDTPEEQAVPEEEGVVTPEAVPEASTTAASEEAPPVEPESPHPKNNCK